MMEQPLIEILRKIAQIALEIKAAQNENRNPYYDIDDILAEIEKVKEV